MFDRREADDAIRYAWLTRVQSRLKVTEDGCWEFTGARASGYGRVNNVGGAGKAGMAAHVISYLVNVGPIPDGHELDHLCRNRACSNPAHLEAVERRENLMRGETVAARNASVTTCPKGHTYTPENTIRRGAHGSSTGGRECRLCTNDRSRKWRENRRVPR